MKVNRGYDSSEIDNSMIIERAYQDCIRCVGEDVTDLCDFLNELCYTRADELTVTWGTFSDEGDEFIKDIVLEQFEKIMIPNKELDISFFYEDMRDIVKAVKTKVWSNENEIINEIFDN